MTSSGKIKRNFAYFFVLVAIPILVGLSAQTLSEAPIPRQLAQVTPYTTEATVKKTPPLTQYVQIIDGCGPDFNGTCAKAYSKPSSESSVITQLRIGTVLKVERLVTGSSGVWYKIEFDELLRYPERVPKNWYVDSAHVKMFEDIGVQEINEFTATSTKYIIIDRSDQTIYAYEDGILIMHQAVSTGLAYTPTPRGIFEIYKKTPTRYMQGPLPWISNKYYDLPGVPWNLYFTHQGAVIHGTYWHDKFGQQWSNGCVNVPTDLAEKLYGWADIGTPVIVQD